MRILHVYKDYYPPICGGIEIAINRIIEGIRDECEDVSVLICSRKRKSEIAEVEGTTVYKAGEWGRFLSAPMSPYFPYWLKKLKADILHYHLPNPTAVLSHLLVRPRGKIVVHYHSDIIRQKRWLAFYDPFRKAFLNQADRIIVTSPNYLQTSDVLRPYQNKCDVVPLGIPLNRYTFNPEIGEQAQVIRRRYGDRLVLFVGILRYYKGLHVLIEAMKQVEGKLLIVGDGPLLANLMEFANRLRLTDRVIFLGQVESVRPYYFASDVFCLPSIYRSEAFGLVLAEAASCGRPLVSTELGTGTSYVNLHKETGLVVPPNNQKQLADALNQLLADKTLRIQYGNAARTRAAQLFCQETMARDVLKIYKKLS